MSTGTVRLDQLYTCEYRDFPDSDDSYTIVVAADSWVGAAKIALLDLGRYPEFWADRTGLPDFMVSALNELAPDGDWDMIELEDLEALLRSYQDTEIRTIAESIDEHDFLVVQARVLT